MNWIEDSINQYYDWLKTKTYYQKKTSNLVGLLLLLHFLDYLMTLLKFT